MWRILGRRGLLRPPRNWELDRRILLRINPINCYPANPLATLVPDTWSGVPLWHFATVIDRLFGSRNLGKNDSEHYQQDTAKQDRPVTALPVISFAEPTERFSGYMVWNRHLEAKTK